MRAGQAGLVNAIDVAKCGNPAAASDVAVAVELLTAASRSAALNVRVNLKSIREVGYVDGVRAEVERLEASAAELASDVTAALS
jgi:formiminotetrahydrofolate cyclodeaminase